MTLPGATSIPSAAAALLMAGLLAFVWRRSPSPRLRPCLATLLLGGILYALGDLVSLSATSATVDRAGGLAIYGGLAMMAVSLWMLALRTGELHGVRFRIARSPWVHLPAVWMSLLFLTALTDPWHGRFATPVPGAPNVHHVLWYVDAASGYALVLATLALLAAIAVRGRGPLARSHALTIGLATAVTLLASWFYVTWPRALPIDPTALALCAGILLLVAGITRRGLFALSPVPVSELLRQGSDGLLLLDPSGRLLDRNPAAEAWLPEEVVFGERLVDHWRGRFARSERPDVPLGEAELAAALLSDDPPSHGHLLQQVGGRRLLRVEPQPVRGSRGSVVCRLLRLRDETNLRRLSDALGEQASMLSAVLAATDEGILVHVGSEIRFANPQFHAIWRTPPELRDASRGGSLLEAYLPMVENRESFLATVERVERDREAVVRDDIRLRDGRVLERTSLPLVQDGVPVGRVWRVRDVTEQRRNEEAVRAAQKVESLGVMAGGVAHDFNNLLVAMMGNAGLARAELGPGSPARDYLADIERAAERASELTRQLLAYAGKGRVELAPVDVSHVVRDVVELLAVSIPKRVALHCDLAGDLPPVVADASQLRQVVMNLLLNAVDAIGDEEGVVTVTTGLRRIDPGEAADGDDPSSRGPFVALGVADTGVGMDASVRARIFDPFFSTKFAGRGLGLAATLGIVRRHHGVVRVDSEPGRGSLFTVLLPAAEGADPVREAPRREPGAWTGRATILVVDDDPTVGRVARRLLLRAGLDVVRAESGSEAVAAYRARGAEIDAVLLDLTMPDRSGPETLRDLRALDPEVRVVFTSGYPEEEAAAQLAGEPSVLFVQKPYRAETLLAKIRQALDAPPGPAPSAP